MKLKMLGRMLKMAWNDNDSKIGLAVTGKYGKYYVKENIGNDGNGEVFVVEIIDGVRHTAKRKRVCNKIFNG